MPVELGELWGCTGADQAGGGKGGTGVGHPGRQVARALTMVRARWIMALRRRESLM